MATFKEAKAALEEHPGFSNLDVRGEMECPCCGARLRALFHFYPETFKKWPKDGNHGFSFMEFEFVGKPKRGKK